MNQVEQNDMLETAMAELKQQETIYQPTAFWAAASERIAQDFKTFGVSNFRKIPTATSYFVPNYSGPASGLNHTQTALLTQTLHDNHPQAHKAQQAWHHFVSGKQAALADYRVLLSGDQTSQLPQLQKFSESEYGQPVEQFVWNGQRFSRSSLNYLLGLCFLKQHLGEDIPRTVLEIGGGFGTLGEIWSQSDIPDWKYIDIDIPPTQFAADQYLKAVLGDDQVTSFDQVPKHQPIQISDLKPASVLCSWQIAQLQGEVDLFVNFISFQEMEPDVVTNYLGHVNRLKARWVLLRNMREGKQVQKEGHVGVKTPIKSDDYVRMLGQYQLVDSNVHPFGYETVDGYHSELLLFKRV
jgi:putative sugar O-methyltransferase